MASLFGWDGPKAKPQESPVTFQQCSAFALIITSVQEVGLLHCWLIAAWMFHGVDDCLMVQNQCSVNLEVESRWQVFVPHHDRYPLFTCCKIFPRLFSILIIERTPCILESTLSAQKCAKQGASNWAHRIVSNI